MWIFVLFLGISLLTNSCQSNSKSGKAKLIATVMAKKEANKKTMVPEPNTIKIGQEPKIVKLDDILTSKERTSIDNELVKNKIPPAVGNLIQVEGLVLKDVSELNIKLNTSGSQVEQIVAMQKHVYKNWHYIFDPIRGRDTWRSAEATLSLKYKGQYSGDCDDFAILMASFARQIGLRSRMVGGYDGNSGHAFAEFLVPETELNNIYLKGQDYREDYRGKWISLDWFKGKDHSKYNYNIKIFEDI